MGMWRHRDFLLLWGGQAISQAGSQVTVLALPLVAIVILHATTFQVGSCRPRSGQRLAFKEHA